MPRTDTLNKQQREVVEETQQGCCVIAVPGSGKTKTCTEKIASLLRQHVVEGGVAVKKCVMAVTFTAEAARELKERTSRLVPTEAMDRLTTGTFHSIFLARLKAIGSEVAHRRIAAAGQYAQYRERSLAAKTRWWNDGDKEVRDFLVSKFELHRCMGSIEGKPSLVQDMDSAVGYYKTLMKEHGLLDFAMILDEAVTYLKSKEGIGIERTSRWKNDNSVVVDFDMLKEKFGFIGAHHILVDEGQDIDAVQLNLMFEMAKLGCVVDMVGDDDQSIYRFRLGLGYEGMRRFVDRTHARTLRLETNYRCKDEILELAVQVIERNRPEARQQKQLVGNRGPGGVVTLDECTSGGAEVDAVKNWAVGCIRAGQATGEFKTMAVLARLNKSLDVIQGEFTRLKVEHKRLGGGDLWSEAPACFMLEALEGMTEKSGWRGAQECLYWAGVSIGQVDAHTLQPKPEARMKERDRRLVSELKRTLTEGRKRVWSLRPSDVAKTVKDVHMWFVGASKTRGGSKKEADVTELRVRIVTRTLAGDAAVDECDERISTEAGGSAQAGQERQSQRPGLQGSLAQRVKAIRTSNKTDERKPGVVHLVSMHGSKGLEWDKVWIVSCDDSSIPGSRVEEDGDEVLALEEERRLLYVAITRARDELRLSWSPWPMHKKPTKRAESESRFLMELKRRPVKGLVQKIDHSFETTM